MICVHTLRPTQRGIAEIGGGGLMTLRALRVNKIDRLTELSKCNILNYRNDILFFSICIGLLIVIVNNYVG